MYRGWHTANTQYMCLLLLLSVYHPFRMWMFWGQILPLIPLCILGLRYVVGILTGCLKNNSQHFLNTPMCQTLLALSMSWALSHSTLRTILWGWCYCYPGWLMKNMRPRDWATCSGTHSQQVEELGSILSSLVSELLYHVASAVDERKPSLIPKKCSFLWLISLLGYMLSKVILIGKYMPPNHIIFISTLSF